MGLFSSFRKNKQKTDQDQGVYRSRADAGVGQDASQAEIPLRARKARTSKTASQQNEAVDPALPEKKRARRRLIGAVALVLTVVIILPMILDSEPKLLADDIAIQIPSRDKSEVSAFSDTAVSVGSNGLDKREEIVEPVSSLPPVAAPPTTPATLPESAVVKPAPDSLAVLPPSVATPNLVAPKSEVKSETKSKAEVKAKSVVNRSDDSARALAILYGHADAVPATVTASEKKLGKFVLQVAALESQDRVDELQSKLKEAGIRSYEQKVSTTNGERIRIRVGPFDSKEDAEKACAELAKLGLNGNFIQD